MGFYAGTKQWIDQVYQFEETDLVQAETDNLPLQQLADRTAWLRGQIGVIDRLNDDVIFTESATIPGLLGGHLIVAYSSGIMNLLLENAASFKHGALVPISSFCNPACVVNIKAQPGQPIFDTDGSIYEMHMHHKEQLILMALTDHWKVVSANGNFFCAGEEIKGRKELLNTIALRGQLLERARYPRLWKFAQTLTLYQEIVPENLWLYDGTTYRSCYSTGDGQTTFRLPDERGMTDRMLDLGRGIDLGRTHNFAGGYEADDLKSHSHPYRDRYYPESLSELNKQGAFTRESINLNSSAGSNATDKDNNYVLYMDSSTGNAGGLETRMKNIGKLNLIKY